LLQYNCNWQLLTFLISRRSKQKTFHRSFHTPKIYFHINLIWFSIARGNNKFKTWRFILTSIFIDWRAIDRSIVVLLACKPTKAKIFLFLNHKTLSIFDFWVLLHICPSYYTFANCQLGQIKLYGYVYVNLPISRVCVLKLQVCE